MGTDRAGRVQYLYHRSYRQRREKEKYGRLVDFGRKLPSVRDTIKRDLRLRGLPRDKVLAAMLLLTHVLHFRVGGERYAATEQGTYGICTLRRKHVSIHGSTITFDFRGKWGKSHTRSITDATLSRVIARCLELPGHELFKYEDVLGNIRDVKSHDINRYVKSITGSEFSAKDFRTWAGTLIAACKLAELGPATSQREWNSNIVKAIDEVANQLGNTRAIARGSYVSPFVLERYQQGIMISCLAKPSHGANQPARLSKQERELMRLLTPSPFGSSRARGCRDR